MNQDRQLELAIVENLRLKSKILVGIFFFILLGQFVIMLYLFFKTDLIFRAIPGKAIVVGPLFLITIIASELFFERRLKKFQRNEKGIPRWLPYFVVMIECSFPTTFILIANSFLLNSDFISPQQLITSPPLLMYIIMIILSSLTLDLRISVFSGLVAGGEYLLVSLHVLRPSANASTLDHVNVIFRSALIFLCGMIAGLISKKIRDAVQNSVRDKNTLIHKLDHLVSEKTKEVTLKNDLLELKQKEIIDSIHYAKRIQDSHLPTEKYIQKKLND
ncbi:MAG: hypothetical protein HY064_17140 [Bacteroidetes bacterium]|nr:hypothetical protein [Bacteroidota bacterium]